MTVIQDIRLKIADAKIDRLGKKREERILKEEAEKERLIREAAERAEAKRKGIILGLPPDEAMRFAKKDLRREKAAQRANDRMKDDFLSGDALLCASSAVAACGAAICAGAIIGAPAAISAPVAAVGFCILAYGSMNFHDGAVQDYAPFGLALLGTAAVAAGVSILAGPAAPAIGATAFVAGVISNYAILNTRGI